MRRVYSPRCMSCTSSRRRHCAGRWNNVYLCTRFEWKMCKIIFVSWTVCRKIKNNNSAANKIHARCSTVEGTAARGPRMVLKRSSYSVAHTDRPSGCRAGFITFPRRRVVSGPKPPLSHATSQPQHRRHRHRHRHRHRRCRHRRLVDTWFVVCGALLLPNPLQITRISPRLQLL